MEKTPYHDSANYIDDEYDDDFDVDKSKQQSFKKEESVELNKEDSEKTNELNRKLNHVTDTSNYNSFEFCLLNNPTISALSII